MVTSILYDLITELKQRHLPGKLLAMVEERVYALLYKGEIFIIYEPLDGFYGIYDECPTIEYYIREHKDICIETIKSQGEIYEEELLEIYLHNGPTKGKYFDRVYEHIGQAEDLETYWSCHGYKIDDSSTTEDGMLKITYKSWN